MSYNERGNKYNKSKNFYGDKSQKSLKSNELGERVKKNNKIIFGKGGNSVLPLHSQTANKRTECGSSGIKFKQINKFFSYKYLGNRKRFLPLHPD
jgi:hypothetical protein